MVSYERYARVAGPLSLGFCEEGWGGGEGAQGGFAGVLGIEGEGLEALEERGDHLANRIVC